MLQPRPFALALAFALVLAAASASAETLRCRSVNGNTTCSGSGAVSCQTVNGRTTCVGGHGAAVQSFGSGTPMPEEMQGPPSDRDGGPDAWGGKEDSDDDAPPRRASPQLSIDRRDANGPVLSLEQSEGRLRLRTRSNAIAIDR